MKVSKSVTSLTGGVVEDLSFGAHASLVEGKHRHQERVAALAVEGAVGAGGVAGFLAAVASLDEGLVAVSVRHRVPRERAVSFRPLHDSQRLWWAGVWWNRTAGGLVTPTEGQS